MTKLGAFGQTSHVVGRWAPLRGQQLAARYDEAYHWLNATVHDTWTGAAIPLTDVDGTPLPKIAGWIAVRGVLCGRQSGLRWRVTGMSDVYDRTGPIRGCSSSTLRLVEPWGVPVAAMGPRPRSVRMETASCTHMGTRTQTLWMYDVSNGTDVSLG